MADNVAITAGSGTSIATDDVGGAHYQKVKLYDSTADASTGIGTGGGTEAAALRVTVANDSTGVVSVDDNGGALTVDNGGTFAVQVDGAALTALQLSDDVVHADDAARGKSTLIGAVLDDAATTAITENQAGYLRMSSRRALLVEGVASGTVIPVSDGAGSLTVDAPNGTPVFARLTDATLNVGVIDETGASAVDALAVGGGTAHDAADSGNPIKVGGVAVSGSATPTSVAASDRTRWIFNQHGIPYVLGGHPNLITREYDFGTTAQTDTNLAAAVVAGDERIYVTRFEAMCDNANSVAVSVRAGFGTASVPTASSSGVSGMIGTHPGVPPGSGFVCGNGAGIIAVGGAGEEPRLTSSAATSGNLHVLISYFLVDETP